jgi:Protein of unknown function (DUF3631)/Toprim domain
MRASTNTLSAADQERLDTFAVEIAEDALGVFREENKGSWRLSAGRSLIIHPGALWHDFRSGSGGRGTLSLIKHLHSIDDAAALRLARKHLAEHPGEGRRLAASAPDEEAEKSEAEDARRTAEIQALFERRLPSRGTPVERYLVGRHLQPDDSMAGWIEPSWPGGCGEMITAATDEKGKVLAIQLTRLTSNGGKAAIKCPRITLRGPHDWSSRAALRLNCDDGPIETLHLVEGFEDGLSLVAAGVRNIWVLWGLGRLRHLSRDVFPLGVKTLVVVRDDDRDTPPAELSLWQGVTRLMGLGIEVKVTPRPRLIAPDAPDPMKDVNDLHCRVGPTLVQALMAAPPVGKDDLTEAAREAIYEEASKMDSDAYDQARKAIIKLLDLSLSATLDNERKKRIDQRRDRECPDGDPARDTFRLLPWEDPVTDIGAVLDDMAAVLKKILASPDTHIDAQVLWGAHTHVRLRKELGVRHSARLAFQSQFEDSGKTTAMTTLKFCAARAMATSSLTGASLFRETDAHHWTVLWDEADNAFHKNTNPELIGVFNAGHDRYFALVHRQVPSADGGYETSVFDTFTAIALTAINEFQSRAMQSRCIVLVMKRATRADAARLEEFDEGHEAALTVCGRKLVRWAVDLEALPTVDKAAAGLINRIWLNWKPLLQIAQLAGWAWPARALAAARADMARVTGEKDDSPEYALLAAIWRVLAADKSTPRRMHTLDLLTKLLNEDEGRWFTAGKGGKQIDEYYLRSKLKKLLPTEGEYSEPTSRRWRPTGNPSGNPLNGYHELHFADAFERYLGKGLPSGKPETGDVPAHSVNSAPGPGRHTPKRGPSESILTDPSDTSAESVVRPDTCVVHDLETDSTHVPVNDPSRPTQGQAVSDDAPSQPARVSNVGDTFDTKNNEQHQIVSSKVLDGTDKSATDGGGLAPIPEPGVGANDVDRGVLQFPKTPAGRKALREPPL